MYTSQKPKINSVAGLSVWLRKGSAMSTLHQILEVGPTFPVFQSFPTETRTQKELRWKQQFRTISDMQHEFVTNALATVFASSLGTWVDKETVAKIDTAFRAFADSMTVQKVPIMMSHSTLLHSGGCIEFTVSYTLNGHQHSLNFCNFSPSEYERRVH